MREVLSISLSNEDKKKILSRAKKAGLNVSAYILAVLKEESDMISEEELLLRAKGAEKNYKKGNVKELGSLAELINDN